MIRQLMLVVLSLLLVDGAWARSEFRLGGVDGNTWQGLLTEENAVYLIVDRDGVVTSTRSIGFAQEVAGIDTMIDYANNSIGPVWVDPNENLSRSLADRKGHINSSVSASYAREATKALQVLIDGDPSTALLRRVEFSPRLQGLNIGYVKNLIINLGAELPINRIRFFPRPGFEENYLQWYEIGVADGTAPFVSAPGIREPEKRWYYDIDRTLTASNDPALDILQRNTENLDAVVDYRFPTRDLRWIAIRPVNAERDWEIAEFEIYGDGFVTNTSYTSPILDFGKPVAWSKVRWKGAFPEGSQITLRTRTGSTSQPYIFWRVGSTGEFEQVTQSEYRGAYNSGLYSQIRREYNRETWSLWSPPYDFDAGLRDEQYASEEWIDGVVVQSPSPTRYLQFQVLFRSSGQIAPRIDEMEFLFDEQPAAQEVLGEIWPLEIENFDVHTFTYVVRPLLDSGDKGFDKLEIFTQTRAEVVRSVLVDGVEMLDRFSPEIEEDRIVLSFDRLEAPQDNEKRIEVVFDAKVLRFGTEFTGWVYDSAEPELKQQIKPGNATFRFGGDALAVRTPMSGQLISEVQLSSKVLTPNGDGINDDVRIEYDVRNVEGSSEVVVNLFDLTGRLIHQVGNDLTGSGSFEMAWDGRDDSGVIVSPGIYMYQVELDVDGGSKMATGIISVAY